MSAHNSSCYSRLLFFILMVAISFTAYSGEERKRKNGGDTTLPCSLNGKKQKSEVSQPLLEHVATINVDDGSRSRVLDMLEVPNNRLVSLSSISKDYTSRQKTLKLWNLEPPENPACLATFIEVEDTNCAPDIFFISQSGQLVACLDGITINVWNLEKSAPECVATLESAEVLTENQWITKIIELPNGRWVLGCSDGTLIVWSSDQQEGSKVVTSVKEHSETINNLFERPNHVLLSSSDDGTLILWSVDPSGCLTQTNRMTIDAGSVLRKLSDDKLVSLSEDGKTFLVWKLTAEGSILQCVGIATGHTNKGDVKQIIERSGGQLLSCSSDGTIKLWEVNAKERAIMLFKCLATLEHDKIDFSDGFSEGETFDAAVLGVTELSDNMLVSFTDSGVIKFWNLGEPEDPQCIFTLLKGEDPADPEEQENPQNIASHTDSVYKVIQRKNGQLISCSGDGTLKIWAL